MKVKKRKFPPTGRELESQQVELAIARTTAAQLRAQQTLDALYDKKTRQIAELRFQKMLLAFDRQKLAASAIGHPAIGYSTKEAA